jgi:2-polyprenyl-3-methyl-5-hydroxy-6-metoxy-1,4-benzoquinol methylase
MRAVICAAGSGSRWRNYLGTRKHFARINGEALLLRAVRLLRQNNVHDITIYSNPDHPYVLPGVTCITGGFHANATTARKLTRSSWSTIDQTLLMLGDVYYTEETIATMTTPTPGFHQFGRLAPSKATGKPGAEMYGWQFGPENHEEFIAAIDAVDAARDRGIKTHVDWSTYAQMTGHNIDTPPDQIRDWGKHIEIPDDGTDDFDFPDDYERFMGTFFGRSARRVKVHDFNEPWFQERMVEIAHVRRMHRKLWEFVSIAQAYKDRIGSGGRCLGFGVGKEPLPAWFAAQGAEVVATDRPDKGVWLDRQHSAGFDELRREGICEEDVFQRLASYQPVDMRNISSDLRDFDFTWSASCFEHLGGIQAGIEFFLKQMHCLKRGGIAVHTTEYLTSSNEETLDSPNLCFFRQRDLLELMQRMATQGDRLWGIDLTPGTDPVDAHVDQHPFGAEPHLNLQMGTFKFTSVLLIGMRGYDA